jgi:hypothetical protein
MMFLNRFVQIPQKKICINTRLDIDRNVDLVLLVERQPRELRSIDGAARHPMSLFW